MDMHFAEGDFQLPAPGEPGHDLAGAHRQVGTQQGLRLERAFRIANQDPPNRHGRLAGVIPHGGRRDEFDQAPPSPYHSEITTRLRRVFRCWAMLSKVGKRWPLTRVRPS